MADVNFNVKLYLVTCVYNGWKCHEEYPVYVVALNPTEVEEIALSTVRKLGLEYTSHVNRIEVIASTSRGNAESLLCLEAIP